METEKRTRPTYERFAGLSEPELKALEVIAEQSDEKRMTRREIADRAFSGFGTMRPESRYTRLSTAIKKLRSAGLISVTERPCGCCGAPVVTERVTDAGRSILAKAEAFQDAQA